MLEYVDERTRSRRGGVVDRSRHGGAPLYDSHWQNIGALWLVPLAIVFSAAMVVVITSDKAINRQICDVLREFRINGPESCRNIIWVRAKSRTIVKPIVNTRTPQVNQRRS